MLIGNASLDYKVIREFVGDKRGLIEYTDSLVPVWARHIPQLIQNQHYYVAIHVRNMLQIPFYKRKELYDFLIDGCSVQGVINEFLPIQNVFDVCDIKILAALFRRDYEET